MVWDLSKYSVGHQAQEIIKYLQTNPASLQESEVRLLVRAAWHGLNTRGTSLYHANPYQGEVVIFQAEEGNFVVFSEWQEVVKGPIQVHQVKGNHGNHIRAPYASEISALLRRHFQH